MMKKIMMGPKPSAASKLAAEMKKPETVRFTIDLDEASHRKFKALCATQGVKMADVIREMIESRIEGGAS